MPPEAPIHLVYRDNGVRNRAGVTHGESGEKIYVRLPGFVCRVRRFALGGASQSAASPIPTFKQVLGRSGSLGWLIIPLSAGLVAGGNRLRRLSVGSAPGRTFSTPTIQPVVADL